VAREAVGVLSGGCHVAIAWHHELHRLLRTKYMYLVVTSSEQVPHYSTVLPEQGPQCLSRVNPRSRA
jgi:hypothetical protein